MQFFFCEKCGKRVTDQDLASGSGKNKKLKGVYCTDCAEGVLTLEVLPITDEDARRILKQESESGLPKAAASRPIHLPARAGHGARPAGGARLAGQGRARIQLVLLPVLVVAVAVIGALLLARNSSRVVSKRSVKVDPQVGPPVRPDPKKAPDVRHGAPASEISKFPLPALSDPRAFSAPVPPERPGAPAQPEPVVEGPGVESALVQVGPPANPPEREKPPPGPAHAATERAAAALSAWLDVVLPHLAERDYGAALQRARERANDTAHALPAEQGGPLLAALGFLERREELRFEALQKRVGSQVQVSWGNQVAKGKLVKADREMLRVEQPYFINGKEAGAAVQRIPLGSLTARDWEALAPLEEARHPDEWLALALTALSEHRLDEAAAALERSGLENFRLPLGERISGARQAALEADAAEEWKEMSAWAARIGEEKGAQEWLRGLAGFQERFGGTQTARRTQAEREEARLGVQRIAEGWLEKLRAALPADIRQADSRTGRVDVRFDLSDKGHLEPLSLLRDEKLTLVREDEGGLRLWMANTLIQSCAFPFVAAKDLRLKFEYEITRNTFASRGFLCVWLGLGATPREGGPCLIANAGGIHLAPAAQGNAVAQCKEVLPDKGTLEIVRAGKEYAVHLNGKQILSGAYPELPQCSGIGFGGGWEMIYLLRAVEISGTLDEGWMKGRLPAPGK